MRTQQISPSVGGFAVTPSDTQDIAPYSFKGWSVNSDGYVKILLQNHSSTDTPISVYAKAGVRYPDVVRRFLTTGTTATGINAYV